MPRPIAAPMPLPTLARHRLAVACLTIGFTSAALLALGGCHHKTESVVSVGGDKRLTAEQIDADPLALLPGGALAVAKLDAKAFLASSLGPRLLRLTGAAVPLSPAMNFDPRRDLTSIVAGVYSMQGADVAAVAQGNFDQAAILAAADRGDVTAVGQPLRRTEYANNSLYIAGNVGFVVLTSHTLLTGTPTGIRRALDRLRDGVVRREVPDWVVDLLKTPGAQLAAGGDLNGQALASSVVSQAAFLDGAKTARVIANFQSPGVNLAGSLTYPDADRARQAETSLKDAQQKMSLLALIGVSPVRSLQTNVASSDMQFILALDGERLGTLLDLLGTIAPAVGSLGESARDAGRLATAGARP